MGKSNVLAQNRPTCSNSGTGALILETESVLTLSEGLAAVIRYVVTHSDSALSAARVLGLKSPVALRNLAKRHKVRLPQAWGRRSG